MISVRLIGALVACWWLAAPAAGQTGAKSQGPEIRVADNVFLVPDKNARSITGWLIVLAGCADEADGQCTGIAHYLEHLLFINRDNDHRSKVALFADGTGNGWTTHRATAYFQRFPSRPDTNAENLDKLIGYFAGLLTDVRVEPAQAARERNVVLQEYQQNTGRNPFARFSISLNLALMPNEPLGQRVIGSPETIKGFSPEAARAFHARWYSRNNARIVLHGPIEREAVVGPIARHLAGLPDKPTPERVWQKPRHYAAGRQDLRRTEKDARQTAVSLDRIVSFEETASDRLQNDASAGVLGAFLASRLAGSPLDVLVERHGLATDARLSISRLRQGTVRISFSAAPAAGVEPDRLIDAASTYIANLARTGLPNEIVDRLKMRVRNERALLAEQPALYAQALTNWLSALQSYEDWLERSARHEAVTAESVNRFVSMIAGPGREVAGVMLPGAPPSPGPAAANSGTIPPLPENLPQQAE